jgi:hypothetical protein
MIKGDGDGDEAEIVDMYIARQWMARAIGLKKGCGIVRPQQGCADILHVGRAAGRGRRNRRRHVLLIEGILLITD